MSIPAYPILCMAFLLVLTFSQHASFFITPHVIHGNLCEALCMKTFLIVPIECQAKGQATMSTTLHFVTIA